MKLYFAPLEGITTYTYRNTHAEMFGFCDEYYAPFINPSENEKISMKNLRDISPERNQIDNLKIQVLTNNVESFLKFEDKVCELGYDEININLGCPSGTVVHKGRGAGFLADTDALDSFFEGVFSKTQIKISVKTRSGLMSGSEIKELMKVYNKYLLSLLIVHPRARKDFYKGTPDLDIYEYTCGISENKICYNGDILSVSDYTKIKERFPKTDSIMIGRGAIANPAIFREIKGGETLKKAELIEFTERLSEKYLVLLKSETFTLQKMKEIWMYIMWNYEEEKKILKAIKKSTTLSDLMSAINALPEL